MTAQMGTLTYEEYQQVLAVLQRDAELRQKEQQRISKLVTSLGEQGEKCDCCGDTLTNPSNRKCSVCARHREVKLQSGEWFYRQLQSRFNRSAITNSNYSVAHKDGAGMDPESAQVREFIERLVEALVSGQLDDVKVNRLYTHPEYDRMFACHHTSLCEKLVRLSFALQMAIANKPVPDDETPSAVHAALKQQIQSILQEAMALPNLQNKVSNENRNAVHHWDEDITTKTYEDILSTAILNKVIQQFQQRNRNSTRFTETTFEDTMDSNKNILQNSDMEEQKIPKFISTVEIGVNSSGNLTGTNMSTTGDRSWITSSSDNPMSMTIEECIEEVTTYDSVGEEEEEEESNEDLTTSAGSELDFYLSGLNFIKQRRVPFPEFGMDIIDGSKEVNNDNEAKAEQQSDSSESPHPTDLVTPIDSWEENWLFQRRRLKAGTMTGNSQGMPVPMLVPNPSEDFRALIGDRDAEEVSDLSDCSDAALEDIVLADVEPEKKATTLVQDAEQHNSCARENDLHESIAAKAFSRIEAINPDNSREQLSNDITGSQEEHCSMDSDKNIFGSTTDEMEASSLELNKASSVECLSEFGQQDSEYTEDYASVTQRQLNSLIRLRESDVSPTPLPVPKPRNQQKQTQLENTADENQQNQRQSEETSDIHIDESDPLESSPPKPGTIAEREHRKWESAPPLPNNPYSPENISKRLSRKSLYSISSASSRSSSVDFPELNGESVVSNTVAEPLHVICTSGDPDYKRYGRDYYINQSKSASGERKSHSRLSSPSSLALQHQYHQVFSSPENNVSRRSTRVEKTRSMDNICLPSGLVENEVAKWQKEINQIEQKWLRKLQTNKTEDKVANTDNIKLCSESHNPQLSKEEELIEVNATSNETSDDTLGGDNVDSVMNGTRPSVKAIKASLEGCKQEKNENCYSVTENNHSADNKSIAVSPANAKQGSDTSVQQTIITNGHISEAENIEQTTAKSNKKPERPTRTQVREWKNLSHGSDNLPLNENPWRRTPSECSTVSSDLDLDADVPIVLPSVKELAKHFSGGGTTSDSDSSVSAPKGKSSTPRRMRNSSELQRGKPVIIVEKLKQQHTLNPRCHQPVREVHSLTARSISRQFREGLRQNLPAHFDRNLHTQGGKLSDSGVQSVSSVISSCAENDNDNFDNSISDGPEGTLSKSSSMPVVLSQNEKFQNPDYGKKFSYLKNRISPSNNKTAFLDNADISIGSVKSVYPHQESPMKYRVASYGNLSTNSDMDVGFKFRSEDTTPGYTSDESGTASPVPLSGGRRKLHSSIAFWEQLQQKSK